MGLRSIRARLGLPGASTGRQGLSGSKNNGKRREVSTIIFIAMILMFKPDMKKYYTRGDWHWDHPFPDVGEDGRWEIDLYTVNDCFESGYRGYAALAELEDGRWMTLILLEAEGINRSCYPTLPAAQSALDAALGANTPPLPVYP
jgi:hypothetical protein